MGLWTHGSFCKSDLYAVIASSLSSFWVEAIGFRLEGFGVSEELHGVAPLGILKLIVFYSDFSWVKTTWIAISRLCRGIC